MFILFASTVISEEDSSSNIAVYYPLVSWRYVYTEFALY